MPRLYTIRIPAAQYAQESNLRAVISEQTGLTPTSITGYQLLKKSLDARGKTISYELKVAVYVDEPFLPTRPQAVPTNDVRNGTPVLIIGAGPAGLFAALQLIAQGQKPILIERGKNVRERRRDLAALNKHGIVNPESNYCFGEGGAGTYSDGKLYTRSNKRGDVQQVLQGLVHFGAPKEILYEAHPHIGTNKLPHIIEAISAFIVACGGEVHFNTRLTDILVKDHAVIGIEVNGEAHLHASHLILATGHSARDIFSLLHRKNIALACKPYALGVRIEHPQNLIDNLQYHCQAPWSRVMSPTLVRPDYLPASSYALVSKAQEKSVYSFCMCPGGIIAPATTHAQEIVVNGWSPSKRNNPYANSGMVVAVNEKDFAEAGYEGVLAGMFYQQEIERRSYAAIADGLKAPALRVSDFIEKKSSASLPSCSYLPGIMPADFTDIFPAALLQSLRGALQEFDKKMKGYITSEAVLVATESRTSSPVRIPRDGETLQHPQIKGLYPCAEGAGYAGGIVSAAIDGIKCAAHIKSRQSFT